MNFFETATTQSNLDQIYEISIYSYDSIKKMLDIMKLA